MASAAQVEGRGACCRKKRSPNGDCFQFPQPLAAPQVDYVPMVSKPRGGVCFFHIQFVAERSDMVAHTASRYGQNVHQVSPLSTYSGDPCLRNPQASVHLTAQCLDASGRKNSHPLVYAFFAKVANPSPNERLHAVRSLRVENQRRGGGRVGQTPRLRRACHLKPEGRP